MPASAALQQALREAYSAPDERQFALRMAGVNANPKLKAELDSLTEGELDAILSGPEPSMGAALASTRDIRGASRLLPAGVRVASGLAATPGGVIGGLVSGGGEGVSQGIEMALGLRESLNPGQIGMQSALGAIPASWLGQGARLAKVIKPGVMTGAGYAGTEIAEGRPVNWKLAAGLTAAGGATGGLANFIPAARRGAAAARDIPEAPPWPVRGAFDPEAAKPSPQLLEQIAQQAPRAPEGTKTTATGMSLVPAPAPTDARPPKITMSVEAAPKAPEAARTGTGWDKGLVPPPAPSAPQIAIRALSEAPSISKVGDTVVVPKAVLEAAEAAQRAGLPPVLVERFARYGVPKGTLDELATVLGQEAVPLELKGMLGRSRERFAKDFAAATPEARAALQDDFDQMGAAYRLAEDHVSRLEATGATGKELAEWQGRKGAFGQALSQMTRQAKKELGVAKKQGGFATVPVLSQLGGAAAGGALGATVDEEHPTRGAIIGALGGASIGAGGASLLERGSLTKLYTTNLLSGPTTHAKNIVSTALNMMWRPVSGAAAGAYLGEELGDDPWTGALAGLGASGALTVGGDALAAALNGTARTRRLGESLPRAYAISEGFTRGAREAFQTIKTGQLPDAFLVRVHGAQKKLDDLHNIEFGGGLANMLNWPSRLLSGMDVWLFNVAESQARAGAAFATLRNQGLSPVADAEKFWADHARLMAQPTKDIADQARQSARATLFKDDPSKFTGGFLVLREKVPELGILVPFVRTIDSISRQAANMTPLAAGLRKVRGGATFAEGAKGAEQAATMLMGTALMLPMGMAAMAGDVTGARPTNPTENALWTDKGIKPFSIRVTGDDGTPEWVSYQGWLGPLGIHLGMVASAVQGWKDAAQRADGQPNFDTADKALEAALGAIAGSMKATLDAHYLADALDLGSVLTEPDKLKRFFQDRLVNFIPFSAALRTVASKEDPIARRPKSFTDRVKMIIPGKRETIAPQIGIFGDPIQQQRPENPLMRYFGPVINAEKMDPRVQALEDAGIAVGLPNYNLTISVGGKSVPVEQTPWEESETAMLRGQAKGQLVEAALPAIEGMPKFARQRVLERQMERGGQIGTKRAIATRQPAVRAAQSRRLEEIRNLMSQ